MVTNYIKIRENQSQFSVSGVSEDTGAGEHTNRKWYFMKCKILSRTISLQSVLETDVSQEDYRAWLLGTMCIIIVSKCA